ncbi:hypothetical protein HDA32_003185 [Spinactinospora alkalitolerans]|uniref:Pyridoxamine 5'-phosphate oxidase N-terminal domain-containing protein n=1 Tax=Spinactinospora alkalitolerans TaxID=687207 RepID=A0A852TXH7_9ACTN|nr:PPOX class F420-dependent oxidoreductase [Spinactinospora alkalitolerans]NYE48065.1 hypothetical protein [Spinactinospora alkalitolerans]
MTALPEDRAGILTKRAFAHIATIGPDGEPHSSPVWIDWDGEFVKFSQTTSRQKYLNLLRDARIALSVHDPDDPHRYLEIRGRVDHFDDDTDNAFINRLARKYLDEDVYPWTEPGEERVVVFVLPERTTQQ